MKTEDTYKNFAGSFRELQGNQQLEKLEVLAGLGLAGVKLAHEIANPLQNMSFCVQMIARQLGTEELNRESISQTLRDLSSEIGRLQGFIQELRDVARPVKLNCVPLSLPMIVAEVLKQSLRTISVGCPIQLQQHLPGNLPLVIADPEKLRQVLANLARNAIEAMPQGGTLTVRAYESTCAVCLEIHDNGVGIPKDFRVFAPFASSKPNGWGLGLCIARQILIAHGGSIDYTSELAHGTTFKVSLPAASEPRTNLLGSCVKNGLLSPRQKIKRS